MMNDIKTAFGLIKYTASKRTVLPVVIIYPLLCLMDFTLYKSLFITPLCIGLIPIILLQYIYAAEMAGFVSTGARRKKTLINGTFGVLCISSALAYALVVVILKIELMLVDKGLLEKDMAYPPQAAFLMISIVLGVFLVIAPFMYRKYILTMVIFIPFCGLVGGVVGFTAGTIGALEYEMGDNMRILGALTSFRGMAILSFIIIVIGHCLFYVTSHLMYKYPMDRFAFRQMFREKKSKA